jgi:hypothetical protein
MTWAAIKRIGGRDFHNTPDIHYRDTITDMPNHGKIMRDEQH